MYSMRWRNLDRDFALFDELRRQMNGMFRHFDRPVGGQQSGIAGTTWPRANLYDLGDKLVVYAAVPGLSEKDIEVSATSDVLSIGGQRSVTVPEGYSAHRQERGSVKFARSFTFPCKVDTERTRASVRDGMLIIEMAKAKEAQPRQIAVKASA